MTNINKRLLNFLYCFIGTNRTGKSATAVKLTESWKGSNPGQDVIAHDPQDNFIGLANIFIEPEDADWAVKCCEYRNCLLILDDYRLINEGNRPVKGLMKLLYFRAKWNIDIIVICHNPGLVINALAHFISHYFIFMTNAQEGSFKNKIPNYSLCVVASEEVNKYVSVYGRGSYPKFPFVIVDCERQKLIAINMENKSNVKTEDKHLDNNLKLLNKSQTRSGIGFNNSNNLKK